MTRFINGEKILNGRYERIDGNTILVSQFFRRRDETMAVFICFFDIER